MSCNAIDGPADSTKMAAIWQRRSPLATARTRHLLFYICVYMSKPVRTGCRLKMISSPLPVTWLTAAVFLVNQQLVVNNILLVVLMYQHKPHKPHTHTHTSSCRDSQSNRSLLRHEAKLQALEMRRQLAGSEKKMLPQTDLTNQHLPRVKYTDHVTERWQNGFRCLLSSQVPHVLPWLREQTAGVLSVMAWQSCPEWW